MSKYAGLDKVDLDKLTHIENYSGGKIYQHETDGFFAVKRGYLVDEQLTTLEDARGVIDHFNTD
jgi:hypothetical protein